MENSKNPTSLSFFWIIFGERNVEIVAEEVKYFHWSLNTGFACIIPIWGHEHVKMTKKPA